MRKRGIALGFLIAFGFMCAAAKSQVTQTREEPVRALIKRFADARNLHNGPAVAALYSDDGEWISDAGMHVRGRAALSELWGGSGVTGHVERTISSIDFPGPHIAVVRVAVQYPDTGKHSEAFILVKEKDRWKIRVHQTVN